jgi:hypothetical protein
MQKKLLVIGALWGVLLQASDTESLWKEALAGTCIGLHKGASVIAGCNILYQGLRNHAPYVTTLHSTMVTPLLSTVTTKLSLVPYVADVSSKIISAAQWWYGVPLCAGIVCSLPVVVGLYNVVKHSRHEAKNASWDSLMYVSTNVRDSILRVIGTVGLAAALGCAYNKYEFGVCFPRFAQH